MKLNKLLRGTILIASSILLIDTANAAFSGNATPTTYNVTLRQVSFHRVGTPADTFIPYATGSGDFDIASVSANSPVGTLSSNKPLAPGNYDEMRFEVSKTMTIKASYNGADLGNGVTQCRTQSNPTVINDPFGDGSVSVAYTGSTDGGAAEESTVVVPTGSSVELPSGFSFVGNNIQGTVPLSDFEVTSDGIPEVTTKFDVTNSVMFAAYMDGVTPSCVVFPGPPSITVT